MKAARGRNIVAALFPEPDAGLRSDWRDDHEPWPVDVEREPLPIVAKVDQNAWFALGACRGMNAALFFPTRGEDNVVAAAKKVCASCPVRSECLEYAMTQEYLGFGIWGGTSQRERRRLRRERRRSAA